jgi:hypothetical protein
MNKSKPQALFSMVFFDTKANDNGSESIIVGRQWWLFPAITIPLTIFVFALWVAWQRYRNRVDLASLGISDLMRIAGPDVNLEKSPDLNYQGPM